MEYEDFKIGDRVGRYYGDKIEKATVIDIQHGMYLLKFDNEDYEDLFSDQEKIFKIKEEEEQRKND